MTRVKFGHESICSQANDCIVDLAHAYLSFFFSELCWSDLMFIALAVPGHSHMVEMTLGRPKMVVGVIMTATTLTHTLFYLHHLFFVSFLLICLYFVVLFITLSK